MKRKIKPVPVIILLSVLLVVGLYKFGIIPSFSEVRQSLEPKVIEIDEVTTWDIYDSPYYIKKPVEVGFNATLFIEPGVEIILSPDVYFLINGRIAVEGDREAPVTFRALEEEQAWEGIYMGSSCLYQSEELVDRRNSSFNYTRIEGAEYGIKSVECPFDIRNSIISSCLTGLSLDGNANSRISNNLFQNCGEAILAEQQGEMTTVEMIRIENNEFLDCDHITLKTSALFKSNQVHDFNTNYSALLIATADSHRIQVRNNQFTNLDRAIEIETVKNAEVLVLQNCFKDNGTNLYMNCNNASQAAIQIRNNNFLDYKQFNVKALSGCNSVQEERIPLVENWWGTSDLEKIESSIAQYSPASSVLIKRPRFAPTACNPEEREGDASLVKLVEESNTRKPEQEKTTKQLWEEQVELKKMVPPDEAKTNDITINNQGGILVINGDTIKLPNGENIAPMLDSIMKERFNTTTTKPTKRERTNLVDGSKGPINIPAEAVVENFAFDEPGENNMIYICKRGVYTAFNKENQVIYADRESKVFLNSSGNHTVYLAKGAEIKVSDYSKDNIIYYHPEAKLAGNLSTSTIQYKMVNPDLKLIIDPERKSGICVYEDLVED